MTLVAEEAFRNLYSPFDLFEFVWLCEDDKGRKFVEVRRGTT